MKERRRLPREPITGARGGPRSLVMRRASCGTGGMHSCLFLTCQVILYFFRCEILVTTLPNYIISWPCPTPGRGIPQLSCWPLVPLSWTELCSWSQWVCFPVPALSSSHWSFLEPLWLNHTCLCLKLFTSIVYSQACLWSPYSVQAFLQLASSLVLEVLHFVSPPRVCLCQIPT